MTLQTNGEIALQLELTGGDSLRTLLCAGKAWSAFAPEVEIRDDFRNRIYLLHQAECTALAENSFRYTWSDADFTVEEHWQVLDDTLSREFELTLRAGAPQRSVSFMELLPYPENVYGWTMWTAYESFPSEMEWVGGRKIYYGDVCYGTVLPCMSFYSTEKDYGILLGVPQGKLPGGRLAFTCRDYHSEGIEVEFSDLLLSDAAPVKLPLWFAGQRGDFRCTLAFWKRHFPEYFARQVYHIEEDCGPFIMTNPEVKEESLDRAAREFAPGWAEVHNHYSKYGEYAPETAEWESILKHDYPADWVGEPLNAQKVNRHIAALQQRHIRAMLYLQCTGDCFIPYAEAEFPEDIARDAAGNLMKSWMDCCFVSARPGSKFYRHILRQIDRFLEMYPDIDGVFLDQLCYQALDFAHADGHTAHRNREVSRYGDTYNETVPYLSRKLHAQGRTLWANGPYCLDVAKEVDGIMAEGSTSLARTTQYMTVGAKSLLIASYATTASDVERMFRHCLVCGGNYAAACAYSKTEMPEHSERIRFLLTHCGRLVKLLAGCQWVLEAHPFSLPEEFEGNLFTLPDGTLALTVVSRNETLVNGTAQRTPEFTAEIRLPQRGISKATEYSVGGDTELAVKPQDGGVAIAVTGHTVFSVILLKYEI